MSERAIHWYSLHPGSNGIPIPFGSEVLTARERDGGAVVYVEERLGEPVANYTFELLMTGEHYERPPGEWRHLGTFNVDWLVCHVFFTGIGSGAGAVGEADTRR